MDGVFLLIILALYSSTQWLAAAVARLGERE
jgi:hypothetical protein